MNVLLCFDEGFSLNLHHQNYCSLCSKTWLNIANIFFSGFLLSVYIQLVKHKKHPVVRGVFCLPPNLIADRC